MDSTQKKMSDDLAQQLADQRAVEDRQFEFEKKRNEQLECCHRIRIEAMMAESKMRAIDCLIDFIRCCPKKED